jgi:hypothetical protein
MVKLRPFVFTSLNTAILFIVVSPIATIVTLGRLHCELRSQVLDRFT